MKFVLPFLIVTAAVVPLQKANPLINTKWRKDDLILFFTPTDTLKMLVGERIVAWAKYTVKDSLLTWRDIPGKGPVCDTSQVGTYIFRITDDRLSFRVLYDKCDGRADVVQTLVLVKQ
jgi:hypothetical protein